MAVPGYLEETAKDYATEAAAAYKTPLQPSTFMGQQFVAPMDQMQTDAIAMAKQGVGSYEPYLTGAGAYAGQPTDRMGAQDYAAQAGVTTAGLGALTGKDAYAPFMSPYQQDVIDTSLQAFDKQAQQQQQALRDQALGVPGAFGGGREGVQQAEYQTGSDLNRAALQAQLMQQNFGQAQTAAQQAFQNQQAIAQGQLGLGSAQMGLSNFQRAGMGADIGAYGQLGALQQGQAQAQLTADQQMKQTQAYEPYGRLGQWGQGITGLAGGVAGMQYNQPQPADPWQSALGTALGVGGIYAQLFGKR
jgi:hypothetical protein